MRVSKFGNDCKNAPNSQRSPDRPLERILYLPPSKHGMFLGVEMQRGGPIGSANPKG